MNVSQMDAVGGAAATPAERIGLAAGAALFVAGVVLVIAVLPAEYGVDPLGIGRRLGLTAMNDTARGLAAFQAERAAAGAGGAPVLAPQERSYQNETVRFTLEPRGSIEYKYRLDKGQACCIRGTPRRP
jgi:hypothetical protein